MLRNQMLRCTLKWLTIITPILVCSPLQASIIDIDLLGMCYHIGANSNNPAYTGAPRRLSADGAWVFNPGAGVSFDFRSTLCDPYWYGISPIVKTIYLRDCDDRPILMGGAGGRFRYSVRDKLLIDLNLLAMIWLGSTWENNKYKFSFLPFANISLQYCLTETVSIGPVFSIIPKNSGFSATSQFNILFISLTSSITLYKPKVAAMESVACNSGPVYEQPHNLAMLKVFYYNGISRRYKSTQPN